MNHAENKNIWSKMKEKLHKYSFLGCLLLAGIVFFTWTDNWQVYTEPLQETYTKGVLLAEQLVEGKWPGISGEQSDATGSVSGNVPGENVKTGDTVSDGNQTDQTMGTVQSPATGEEAAMPETTGTETQDPAATVPVEEIPQEVVYHTVDDSYFDDAVFIGDSRTVGMYEYGGLEETSTFYASTGLTVYKMFDSAIVSVPGQKKKITVEDVKYALSSHFQGTPYDPYAKSGDGLQKGKYRAIGINRNDVMTLIQMRPEGEPVQWLALASNAFNVLAPFYTGIDRTPEYLSATTGKVSTENFYWMSRMIAAMADASYSKSVFHIERYQEKVAAKSHEILNRYDALLAQETDEETRKKLQGEANEKIAGMLQCEAADTLDKVLYELSGQMKNAYARSDA